MWSHHRNLFEIFKATTLFLLAVLLFSVGSASHPTSLMAYLSFSAIMFLQIGEVFASVLSDETQNPQQRNVFLRLSIFLQLVLASVLVAVTDGSGSIYELVYLLPIISAAAKLTGREVAYVVSGAIVAMIGFIVSGEQLNPLATHVKEFQDAVSAMVYFTMAGFLVYFFTQGERQQREQYQSLARTLAQTNNELRQAQTELAERLVQVTKMEERLHQIRQMAVLGEMAGQVAHEVRNPLGIIKGTVELLAGRTKDPATRHHIEVLLEETERVNKAVEGVLRLGAPIRFNKSPVNLVELLHSVVQVSSAWSVPDGVRIEVASMLPMIVVLGDYDLLYHSFANLIRNACESMPSGGTVRISYGPQIGGQQATIMIVDSGVGLSKNDLKRLGEPFFTKRRRGVGLGFSLARRVIAEHGGALEVTSEEGTGTTVTISLPISVPLHEQQLAGSTEEGGS